jgi:peptidoglycan/LPS O-acetylase OafA/YrhL
MILEKEPVQLVQLTSLRFFAALGVVFSHLGFLRTIDNPIRPIAETFFYEGYSGVSFFFVLSGFIICHAYEKRLKEKSISIKKYILLRLLRIYPLHVFIIPFVFYLFFRNIPDYITCIAFNITLLQSWIPIPMYYFSLNAVSWSLSVELFFYLIFIFIYKVRNITLIKIALIWFIIIAVSLAVVIYQGNDKYVVNGELNIGHWVFYINPIFRLLDFIVGILIYRCTNNKKEDNYLDIKEVISILLLIVAMYVFTTYKFPEVLRAQILYLPIMAFIIYSFSKGKGVISKYLKNKYFIMLGKASFSLYITHQPIINIAYTIYQKKEQFFSLVMFAILLTIFCILFSIFFFKIIEEPMYNYLKAKIKEIN